MPTDALRQGDFTGTGTMIYDPATGNAERHGRTAVPQQPHSLQPHRSGRAEDDCADPGRQTPATFPNNYFATGTYKFNRDNIDFKVNYNPTDKLSVFARYSVSPSDLFDPPSLGAAGGERTERAASRAMRPAGFRARRSAALTRSLRGCWWTATIGFTRQRLGAENVDIDKNYGLEC